MRDINKPIASSSALKEIERLARWLDARFKIPGTSIRVGIDSLLGLIPAAGDSISGFIGLYIIWRARGLGAPYLLIARMTANVLLDTLLGAVPILGDVFDIAFKSNQRNVQLLLDHLNRAALQRM